MIRRGAWLLFVATLFANVACTLPDPDRPVGRASRDPSPSTRAADRPRAQPVPGPGVAERRPPEDEDPASVDAPDEHAIYGYPARGRLLRRIGYTAGHDGDYRIPLWVSYRLTRSYVDGRTFVPRRQLRWQADPDIPPHERAEDSDYTSSGYSRGHMAMQSDMRGRSVECETQAYRLSNVCPQRQALNGGAWLDLENACKSWARRYGEIWILCGPILDEQPPARLNGRTPGRVAVPTAFYKIVVRKNPDGSPEVLAFIQPHEPPPARGALAPFLTTVDEIERRTGLDFLAELDDAIEASIEAQAAPRPWELN